MEPSEYVPTAWNDWLDPTEIFAEEGVMAIEVRVGAELTVNDTVVLVTPDNDAVMLAVPAATPVANPALEIVTMPVFELVHVTVDVRS